MSDRKENSLPFESSDAAEQALWTALRKLPEETPSPDLRRGFYRALDEAGNESWWTRLGQALGIGNRRGWITAAASLLIGFGLAGQLNGDGASSDNERLAMLEGNVAMLNRQLILDRLVDANASTRLRGVFDARAAADDEQVIRALLQRATDDRVPSVRSAAIDVLGASLPEPDIGEELMRLLEGSESPTVQLALVDMVLRYGNREQLDRMMAMVRAGSLHDDIARHIRNALGSESA